MDDFTKHVLIIAFFSVLAVRWIFDWADFEAFGRKMRKLKCKSGRHVFKKYFCVHCKAPRKHPHLKVIQGEKKPLSYFKNGVR